MVQFTSRFAGRILGAPTMKDEPVERAYYMRCSASNSRTNRGGIIVTPVSSIF